MYINIEVVNKLENRFVEREKNDEWGHCVWRWMKHMVGIDSLLLGWVVMGERKRVKI